LVAVSAVGFAAPLDAAPLVPPPLNACPPRVAAPHLVAAPLSDPLLVRSICMVGLDAVVQKILLTLSDYRVLERIASVGTGFVIAPLHQ
jgi:hypothetical protein